MGDKKLRGTGEALKPYKLVLTRIHAEYATEKEAKAEMNKIVLKEGVAIVLIKDPK